jgi:hypothetical protein
MRQRLLAIAAVAAAAVAGSVLFINWDTGRVAQQPQGAFEFLDRSQCQLGAACNAAQLRVANAIWADAGSSCSARFANCDVRVGAQARAWAADAGLTLGPQNYQRLRFLGALCPAADGGQNFTVPMGDDGLPQFMSIAQQTPGCVRAPVAGGTSCQRSEGDGGFRYFGAGNVFPAALSNGDPSCQPVGCSVFFGDNPDIDL